MVGGGEVGTIWGGPDAGNDCENDGDEEESVDQAEGEIPSRKMSICGFPIVYPTIRTLCARRGGTIS